MKKFLLIPIFLLSACSNKDALNVYTWSGTIDPAVIQEFESKHQCKVVIENFASNEELFAKLKNIKPEQQVYDVIFPSDYMVSILVAENLLEPLPSKETALNNWKNLDSAYTGLYFDKENKYSAPYQVGLTGLAWDSDKNQLKDISWKLMTDNAFKGKTSLLNDPREAFAVALRILGRKPNESDPVALDKASEILRQIKENAAAINSENFEYLLMNGDVALAHAWNTNILKLQASKPSLRFAVPKEGGLIWMDNLAIAKGAKHKDLAAAFINHFLDPEVARKNTVYSMLATPNKTARTLLPKELQENPAMYPSKEDLAKKLDWIKDLGPETTALYEKLWIQIKGQ